MIQMKSKNSLTSNTTLYREVNGRVRYYRLKTFLTLFGEYLLIREWGGVDNKRATGQKLKYFSSLQDLHRVVETILHAKIKKGYSTSLQGDLA